MAELFTDRLRKWASEQGGKTAWSFLDDAGTVNDTLTYDELERVTTVLAEHLLSAQCGLKAGDRVLLVFFPGLHFTASLIACFKAGIIAVPVFPPDPTRLKKDLHHFVSIQSSCGASVVLTHAAYNYAKKIAGVTSIFSSNGERWPDMRWLLVDDVLVKTKAKAKAKQGPLSLPAPRRDGVAFLQFTSGSTSKPKGVMITHANLAHNLTLIVRELKADQSTVNVSWLPQYHDMGLIGSYLGAVYCGGTGYYLSPLSFLKSPLVWMASMSRYHGTHTQAPNFAYALAARKVREAQAQGGAAAAATAALRLDCVKHMINAAEPVDPVAIRAFCDVYCPLGLPTDVVVPTYGLAEHTVFVASGGVTVLVVSKPELEADRVLVLSSAPLSQYSASASASASASSSSSSSSPSSSSSGTGTGTGTGLGAEALDGSLQSLVGCGFHGRGQGVDLVIVDHSSSTALGPGRVGEIWLRSPSKAAGYWGLPELTVEDFQAKLAQGAESAAEAEAGAETEADSGFLRTGDLGFLHQGELFVCGRLKDLIIVRGANHYPQDIERTAELVVSGGSSSPLRAGCSAAFAVSSARTSTESVVLVAELKDGVHASRHQSTAEAIRSAVSKDHGLCLSSVWLLAPRSIRKTTSGKVTRAGNRRGYLDGSLSPVFRLDVEEGAGLSPAALDPPSWTDTDAPPSSGAGAEASSRSSGAGAALLSLPEMSPEEVREKSFDELLALLEALLAQVSQGSPSPLQMPIDHDAALVELGLDSMSVVQFKGAVEGSLHAVLPDEMMFTTLATLKNLTEVVKHGGVTDRLRSEIDAGLAPAPGQGTATIALKDEPCCPWFIGCC